MKITERQLRRIVREKTRRLLESERGYDPPFERLYNPDMSDAVDREASIEVDWAGDLRELQSLPPGLSGKVISQTGGGGGWPVVLIQGDRRALEDWYINIYSGGDRQAAGDFGELVRESKLVKEAFGPPDAGGNIIGMISADIDGDPRYNQRLTVTHDPSTDEVTILVQDAGAVGGMDYQGPGEGRGKYHTIGKQVLPAGTNGKGLVAAIKHMIKRRADTIKQYGRPTKNFVWGESMYSSGPKGMSAGLAAAALQQSRGVVENIKITKRQLRRIIREEVSRLNETRPRHGIDPREFGRKVIHLRDGRSGVVVAVTRDIILLQSGEQIIPGQVDWPKTNRI